MQKFIVPTDGWMVYECNPKSASFYSFVAFIDGKSRQLLELIKAGIELRDRMPSVWEYKAGDEVLIDKNAK